MNRLLENVMKRTLKTLPALVLLGGMGVWAMAAPSGTQSAASSSEELKPIASLDVPKYMGTWFEIAKYPNRFQKHCVRNTMAQYTRQQDGTITVVNKCQLANQEMDEALGEARQLGDAKSARLEVRFAPVWLSWLPWVWGDYWVIDLDEHYQLAAVSEPKREYLWILSRTPNVEQAEYRALLERLSAKGFDLQKLELTPQGK